MGRVSADLRLQDRCVRARLKPRSNPYMRMICEGQHLGYFKGARGGTWIVRYRSDATARCGIKMTLGAADDLAEANGETILNWKQALAKAMDWLEIQQKGGIETVLNAEITVAEAVEAYIAMRNVRRTSQAGREVQSDAASSLTRHVLEDRQIAGLSLAKLAEADLTAWQLRVQRRRGTIQRVVNDFKAALNRAWTQHRRALPSDLPVVIKHGLMIEPPALQRAKARDNQVLPDDVIRRIIAAALSLDEDFGRLVVLLAATGARFAQVRRMTVGDVQAGQGRVMVPESFKGKRRAPDYIRVQVGADTLSALAPAIEGRPLSAALLERWRYVQVKTEERRNATECGNATRADPG